MKLILGLLAALVLGSLAPAHAQNAVRLCNPFGTGCIDYGESGPAVQSATAASGSSYAAGKSIGGLIQIAAGPSAIVTSLGYRSEAGSTAQVVLRGWMKKPSSSTVCTDNTNFVDNVADDAFRIIGTPLAITPAAPANTQGDASTYGDQLTLTWSLKNMDLPQTGIFYFCIIAAATDSADVSNAKIDLTLSGPIP
jgi:hypothetical protein